MVFFFFSSFSDDDVMRDAPSNGSYVVSATGDAAIKVVDIAESDDDHVAAEGEEMPPEPAVDELSGEDAVEYANDGYDGGDVEEVAAGSDYVEVCDDYHHYVDCGVESGDGIEACSAPVDGLEDVVYEVDNFEADFASVGSSRFVIFSVFCSVCVLLCFFLLL